MSIAVKKRRLGNFMLVLSIVLASIACVLLMLYPNLEDICWSYDRSHIAGAYQSSVDALDDDTTLKMLQNASDYNTQLFLGKEKDPSTTVDIDGITGYLEIPSCHIATLVGDSTSIQLREDSSLPVGGDATNSVLVDADGSALEGLEQLRTNDLFYFRCLNRLLVCQVTDLSTLSDASLVSAAASGEYGQFTLVYPSEDSYLVVTALLLPDSANVTQMALWSGAILFPWWIFAIFFALLLAVLWIAILVSIHKSRLAHLYHADHPHPLAAENGEAVEPDEPLADSLESTAEPALSSSVSSVSASAGTDL